MLTAMEIFINAGIDKSKPKRIEYSIRRISNLYKLVKMPKINMLAVL